MIKLLLVDDEKGLTDYLKDFFQPRGYEVFTATNGRDALDVVKKETPELVLLDVNMPGMDGLEVLRRIKSISGNTKVIMITINDDPDTKQKAKTLGADEFIKKPFTTDALEDIVIIKAGESGRRQLPPKFLIVDDEKGIRDSIKKFLKQRFACEITEADNGQKAMELLKKNEFDLVLLDIKMPGISGLEIIKEKKKLQLKTNIWVITSFDSEEVAHKVIEQGADDYISKPFSLRILDSKIRDFLSRIGKYRPKDSGDSGK